MTYDKWKELDKEIEKNLDMRPQALQATDKDVDECLLSMNTCINEAVEKCVPNRKRHFKRTRATASLEGNRFHVMSHK